MVFFVIGCLTRVKFSSSSWPSWDVDVHRDYDLKVGGLCLPPCYALTKPSIDLLCVILSLRSWERHGWGSLSSVFFQLLFTDPLLFTPLFNAWECLRFTPIWFNGRWKSRAWAEGTQHPWEHGLTSCFMTPNGFVNPWITIVFTVSYVFDFLLINMLNMCFWDSDAIKNPG